MRPATARQCSASRPGANRSRGLALLEAGDGRRFGVRHLDPLDPRRRRTAPGLREEAFDRLLVALHHCLDRAVAPVADPADDTERARGLHRPAPIVDTLDATVDRQAASGYHAP